MQDREIKAINKCRKILNFYQDIQPRVCTAKPIPAINTKKSSALKSQSRYSLYSPASRSSSKNRSKQEFSFSKNHSNKIDKSLSSVNSSSKSVAHSKKSLSFQLDNLNPKESRFDKIMRLKVKQAYGVSKPAVKKQSALNSSFTSNGSLKSAGGSSKSASNNKQNRPFGNQKESRLDKIMNIKILKPQVNSTLINYEPKVNLKSRIQSISKSKQKPYSAVKQWKQCSEKIKKEAKQDQKEDRLWKVFERERELRVKLKKKAQERESQQIRRKQKLFQSLVMKEMAKIEKEREKTSQTTYSFTPYCFTQN